MSCISAHCTTIPRSRHHCFAEKQNFEGLGAKFVITMIRNKFDCNKFDRNRFEEEGNGYETPALEILSDVARGRQMEMYLCRQVSPGVARQLFLKNEITQHLFVGE